MQAKIFYFCSERCKRKFTENPSQYHQFTPIHAEQVTTEINAAGTIYNCTMHPEVRQDKPGVCPKCGMSLEPETLRLALY